MTVILPAASGDVLSLQDYLEYIETHVDVRDEASILASAPQLAALARNRRVLATFLTEALATPSTFQASNDYQGPAFILGRGTEFMVRAVVWPPADRVAKTPGKTDLHIYDAAGRIAHNHNFSFLTVGYWGSGYETDLYECTPQAISGEIGERVELRFCGRERLEPGKVMLYRAHRDVHVQYPAQDYSISLNLILDVREQNLSDQYFFDLEEGSIAGVFGIDNARRIELTEFSGILGNPSVVPHLEAIASKHPARRVRQAATLVLRQFEQAP